MPSLLLEQVCTVPAEFSNTCPVILFNTFVCYICNLKAGVVEVHAKSRRNMRHDVLVVSHARGAQLGGGEGSEVLVTYSRLAEVIHCHRVASFNEI